jgi:hypothetical protein
MRGQNSQKIFLSNARFAGSENSVVRKNCILPQKYCNFGVVICYG